MKYLFLILCFTLISLVPSRQVYEADPSVTNLPLPPQTREIEIIELKDAETPTYLEAKEALRLKVNEYGEKWSLSQVMKERMFKTIVECENPDLDPLLQSHVKDPKGPNGREDSWGMCQINLKYNPEVTKEQAQNVDFCLDWMAERFSKGKATLWSCYRMKFPQK